VAPRSGTISVPGTLNKEIPGSEKPGAADERGGRAMSVRAMNVIDFFEYLAANDDTAELAHELADVWVARQLSDVWQPAA
jgi:hypothetical protein